MSLSPLNRIKHLVFGQSSTELLEDLRRGGASIGRGTFCFDTRTAFIDPTRPWLLEIGEYVRIARGVTILTHDYSLSVLRRRYGEWIGEGAVTRIGSNCFLGMNSTILMGSSIGKNVIVGAGSVVHGRIPGDCVVAGNPARVICTLEEHYAKRKRRTVDECKGVIRQYQAKFGHLPQPADISGFKFLFAPRDRKWLKENDLEFSCNGDSPSEVEAAFFATAPHWHSYEEMCEDAMSDTVG